MPPAPILNVATLDFDRPIADRAAIGERNPHRFEFALLDGVVLADRESGQFAGYYDVRPDAWWARGHIPGRPLMPGVLMIESAAQLMSYYYRVTSEVEGFLGFMGIDGVRFRDTVEPTCRLVSVGRVKKMTSRRFTSDVQGLVSGAIVFEATITGMIV